VVKIGDDMFYEKRYRYALPLRRVEAIHLERALKRFGGNIISIPAITQKGRNKDV
jgi:hypothetical protein